MSAREAWWLEDRFPALEAMGVAHKAVRFGGLWFDAEAPQGVSHVRDLPLVARTLATVNS